MNPYTTDTYIVCHIANRHTRETTRYTTRFLTSDNSKTSYTMTDTTVKVETGVVGGDFVVTTDIPHIIFEALGKTKCANQFKMTEHNEERSFCWGKADAQLYTDSESQLWLCYSASPAQQIMVKVSVYVQKKNTPQFVRWSQATLLHRWDRVNIDRNMLRYFCDAEFSELNIGVSFHACNQSSKLFR